MESFNHLKFAKLEQEIIKTNNFYPGLVHDFSDSGRMSDQITSYQWHFLKLSEYQKLLKVDFKNTDIFFSLFVSSDYKSDNLLFSTLSAQLLENNGRVIKADTTKSPFNFSFVVLCVCKCSEGSKLSYYGSIDSYVEGIHFKKSKTAYNITELSAASDVLTKNVELKSIYSLNFNSGEKKSFFYKNEIENINFYESELYVHLVIGSGDVSNYRINSGEYIYLVGYAGYSKYLNYKHNYDYIYKNIISIRKKIFKILGNDFIATDLSDGFEKSLENMNSKIGDLTVKIDYSKLLKHCQSVDSKITLEHVMKGGDDYSLLLLSNKEISDYNVVKIGCVT